MLKIFSRTFASFLICLIFCSGIVSCSKKNVTDFFDDEGKNSESSEKTSETHKWYSFTGDNFVQIERPDFASAAPFLPWTEAVRISSANSLGLNAYAVVNRLGILTFNNDEPVLTRDVSVFSDRTAGNLFFIDDVPMFTVYKSAFFNDSIKKPEYKFDKSQHFFLVQYDLKSKVCYPVINCNNLLNPAESEINEFTWNGKDWLCCGKTIADGKIRFSYFQWTPNAFLSELSPVNAADAIVVRESDEETFRASKQVLDFKLAPENASKLLKGVSSKVPFVIEIRQNGSGSPKTYRNQAGNYKMVELKAKGALTSEWNGALFEDGTFYFMGYLNGLHILRGGRPVVLRLPKLPSGFVYSDFVIADKTLYAAWEETSFYKTSRSGFISVNLEKTLYNEID